MFQVKCYKDYKWKLNRLSNACRFNLNSTLRFEIKTETVVVIPGLSLFYCIFKHQVTVSRFHYYSRCNEKASWFTQKDKNEIQLAESIFISKSRSLKKPSTLVYLKSSVIEAAGRLFYQTIF